MSKFWCDTAGDSESSDDEKHILEYVGDKFGVQEDYMYHNGEMVKPRYKSLNCDPGFDTLDDNYRMIGYISESHQPFYRDEGVDKRERKRLKAIYYALLGEKYNHNEILSIFRENNIKVNGLKIIELKDINKITTNLFYRSGHFIVIRNSSGYLCDIYHG